MGRFQNGRFSALTTKQGLPSNILGHIAAEGHGKLWFSCSQGIFSASKADGTGAAPDGTGSGNLNEKNELAFTFEDSLGNKGTAVLAKLKAGFQLTMKAETMADPRAAKFYGVIALKRTVDREN